MDNLNNQENITEENRVKTFPQIYIDEKRVGGFTDLNQILRKKPVFNYKKLYEVVKVVTKNLDRVIDINFYPIPETRRSNTFHRPIGIGVQGLADVFAMLEIPFACTHIHDACMDRHTRQRRNNISKRFLITIKFVCILEVCMCVCVCVF